MKKVLSTKHVDGILGCFTLQAHVSEEPAKSWPRSHDSKLFYFVFPNFSQRT